MYTLLHNKRAGSSGNIIYFLTYFVKIPARNSVNLPFKPACGAHVLISHRNHML